GNVRASRPSRGAARRRVLRREIRPEAKDQGETMLLRKFLLAAAIPAGFALFHDFGNYDTAPNVATTALELDAGKPISIASNAIHWREDLFNAVKAGGTVQYFKPNAWYRKIGAAKVGEDITLGGKAIAAGEWALSIKVPGDDTSKFF